MRSDLLSLRVTGVAALALLVVTLLPATSHAQKLVLVVRHAERADGGSMATTAQTDPLLSPSGKARAERLAQMLGEAGITAVYTTEYKRTQDTGQPLADLLKLTITTVTAKDTAGLVARIRKEQASGVVLVVGHSNTVPDIVKAFGGPTFTMDEDEFGDLFVVVPGTGVMTKVKY